MRCKACPRGEQPAGAGEAGPDRPAAKPDRRVGITTTVPVEILLAAGRVPVDLNNVFITHPHRLRFALEAERSGLPRTVCGWNKGVLAAAFLLGLSRVVEVTQGDCSTTEAVGALLKARKVRVYPFAYPYGADPNALRDEMEAFARLFRTSLAAGEQFREKLAPIRRALGEIDRLTWEEGLVSGFENHLYLISGSDFNTDPDAFRRDVEQFLARARERLPWKEDVRVGYIGVPSMIDNLYERVESFGGRVVFNEMQRQFSMSVPSRDLVDQYARYTYPYSVTGRVEDIRREIRQRGIHCVIHYVQTFCFHQVEDPVFRKELGVPILTLEADRPGPLSARDEIRLENFLRTAKPGPRPKAHPPAAETMRLGLDMGSRWVKAGILKGANLVHRELFDPMSFYRAHLRGESGGRRLALDELCRTLHESSGFRLSPEGLDIRATGYGRHLAKMVHAQIVPELQAHVLGALVQTGLQDFTLLDIGGQDTKVVLVRGGRMTDFAMNDRCAAGSGRYLENMARILGVPVEEMGDYAADPVALDSVCATFGESEVIGKIVEGVPEERICAGVNHTLFQRILPDLERFPSPVLLIAGGAARNRALREYMVAERLFPEIRPLPDAHFNGVIGVLHHA